jgi:hypothetical protein
MLTQRDIKARTAMVMAGKAQKMTKSNAKRRKIMLEDKKRTFNLPTEFPLSPPITPFPPTETAAPPLTTTYLRLVRLPLSIKFNQLKIHQSYWPSEPFLHTATPLTHGM